MKIPNKTKMTIFIYVFVVVVKSIFIELFIITIIRNIVEFNDGTNT
jgi:hypothetical protein